MAAVAESNNNDTLLTLLGNDQQLWSPSLQTHRKPVDVLADKIVLLYFSASWCPPCARFTPILKSLYKKLKAEGRHDLELLFVSLDKTQESYDQYTADMPWYCLPYPTQPLLSRLASRYNTTAGGGQLAIPLLIVLDSNRRVLTTDGVSEVSTDPDGTKFPWRPPPLTELFPEHYIDSDKTTLCPMADLDDKYLMLYFSAHWCPPCRAFTPKLSKAYRELKQSVRGNELELLFVSSDRNEAGFTEYFGEMSFGAIPYYERDAKAALSSRLHVQGIPRLVMLGPVDRSSGDRPIVNDNVRACIERGNVVADFPFAPKRYGNLNEAGEAINSCRCVIVFHEGGDDEEQQEVQQTLTVAAEQIDDETLKLFWALSPSGMAKTVRDALKLGPVRDTPVMVLLDLADQGAFYVANDDATDITVDSIVRFVGSPGERKHL